MSSIAKASVAVNAVMLLGVCILGVSGLSRGIWLPGGVLVAAAAALSYGLWKKRQLALGILVLAWFTMPFLTLSWLFSMFDGGSLPSIELGPRIAMFAVLCGFQIGCGYSTVRMMSSEDRA